jgi:hypothetical protein
MIKTITDRKPGMMSVCMHSYTCKLALGDDPVCMHTSDMENHTNRQELLQQCCIAPRDFQGLHIVAIQIPTSTAKLEKVVVHVVYKGASREKTWTHA